LVADARRRRRRIPIWLAAVPVLLCLPLLIPAAIVLEVVNKRRLRRVAASFSCQNCGRSLGAEGVALADQEWARQVRELMRQHPGVRFRLLRTVDAICGGCGARYTFSKSGRTFVMEQDPTTQPARLGGAGG
jgi:hypothetical protein